MRGLVTPCLLALAVGLTAPGYAATFTVTKTGDSGPGSLRNAIAKSNSNGVADIINFAPALSGKIIRPRTHLPALTEGRAQIRGDIDGDTKPDVILSGAVAGGIGLDIRSRENVVRGLVVRHFNRGIAIFGPGAVRNVVAGCYIGTNRYATWALANDFGVYVSGSASYNTIGGTVAADRNVISGNSGAGVAIVSANSNKVYRNLIGLDRTGARPLGNSVGVLVRDSESCKIGNGLNSGRNIISGNTYQSGYDALVAASADLASQGPSGPVGGVHVFRGARHRIAGNYIGTDLTGSLPRGNRRVGLTVVNAVGVAIGGTTAGARNVISANNDGVDVESSHGVTIRGNYVGLNALGNRRVGTQGSGVGLSYCTDTLVGGTTAATRNVISGNRYSGVRVGGGYDNSVLGNYIGLNAASTQPVGNGHGVSVSEGAYGTWIGNKQSGSGNAIVADDQPGISIDGDGSDATRIMRNTIGTNAAGNRHFVGRSQGIRVSGNAGPVTIGGNTKARGNKIVIAPGQAGIHMLARYAGNSTIRNNTILGTSSANPGIEGIRIGASWSYHWAFSGRVADNIIRRFQTGLSIGGPGVYPIVTGNRFSACANAISIHDRAYPNLGNLTNSRSDDDGGNVFRSLTGYAVYNTSSANIRAEGNDWDTTSATTIDGTLIYDQLDNPPSGRVDYDPLIGNVPPTPMPPPSVQLSSLVAVPTAVGAELTFTLSAPADVSAEILNIAGRPVAELRPCSAEAGLTRLSWNGTAATGTRAPGGTYLVRVTARLPAGGQASALATLHLRR